MHISKYLILISLLHTSGIALAMNALSRKQKTIEEAKQLIKPAEKFPTSQALIIKDKIPSAEEKRAITNKLIDLLIAEQKYYTGWDNGIRIPKEYTQTLYSQASYTRNTIDPLQTISIYLFIYLLYEVLNEHHLPIDKTLENNVNAIFDYRNNYQHYQALNKEYPMDAAYKPHAEKAPKNLTELQELISSNIPQLFIDNLIGADIQAYSQEVPIFLKQIVNDQSIAKYFGEDFVDYYLGRREEFCGNKAKGIPAESSQKSQQEPIQALDKNMTLDAALGLVRAGKTYTLFGLPESYIRDPEIYKASLNKDSKEQLKTRYKRLSLKFHPDRNVGNESNAAEVMKSINDFYDTLDLK